MPTFTVSPKHRIGIRRSTREALGTVPAWKPIVVPHERATEIVPR